MTEVAIAGVGMHPCGRSPQLSLKDLAPVAVLSALDDAGMGTKDVQAVYSANAMAGVLQGQEQIRGQSEPEQKFPAAGSPVQDDDIETMLHRGLGDAIGSAHQGGCPQAESLKLAHDPIELAHVAAPVLAERRLLARQHGRYGLAGNFAGPNEVGAVQLRRVRPATARGVAAAHAPRRDRSAQHQADVGQLGQQGTVALLEGFERRIDHSGAFCG
jgi:hypothetical protein